MRLNSLDELSCLLPEEEQERIRKERERSSKEKEYRQQVAYEKYDGRPKSYYTNRRVLPFLPMWMKRKLMEAREIYSADSIDDEGEYVGWDHTITLPLDDKHVVTFGVRDSSYYRILDHDIPILIDVYKDLQRLYIKYGHELSLVRLSGLVKLPISFYAMNNEEEMDEEISDCKDSFIKAFLEKFRGPYDVSLEEMEKEAIKYGEELSENEKKQFHTWFAYEHMQRTEYCDAMKTLLEASGHRHAIRVGWNYAFIDFVSENSEESLTYITWRIGDNLNHLTRFEAVRPLLDKILRKTSKCIFSFGIKPREKCILSRPITSV